MSLYRIICAFLVIPVFLVAQDVDEAIRLFNSFQFERAQEIFVEVTHDTNNPRIAEAYYYLGRLSIEPDSALAFYRTVTQEYPNSRYADISYLEIAKISIARKKYSDAIRVLNELIRNFPETSLKDEVLFWLGVSLVNSGQDKEGADVLQDLRRTFPKSVWSERAANIIPEKIPEPRTEYFTIQVGSYRNKANAETHVQEIRGRKLDVRIVEALIKGTTYYRVWIGHFSTLEEAKAFSLKLDSLGIQGNVVKGY